jgi:hypothetical protein
VKNLRLLPFAAILLAIPALARPPIREPYLQVYVIDPPHPINWSSPKTLFKSTLRNGLEGDYAPNGHLAIHLKTRKPNAYGVTEILTGMGRTNKMKSLWDTLYKQYGLSALTVEFAGDLDSAKSTRHEIKKATRDKRLSIINMQLTDESADQLMQFLDQWIRFGSYRHYGGNKSVPKGEGSGCADFAVHFIRLAMGGQLPSDRWERTVYLPWALLQEAPGRAKQKVSPMDLLTEEAPWAESERDGLKFSIPDPEKITHWVKALSPHAKSVDIYPEEDRMLEMAYGVPERFQAPYPRETELTIREKWSSIRVAK